SISDMTSAGVPGKEAASTVRRWAELKASTAFRPLLETSITHTRSRRPGPWWDRALASGPQLRNWPPSQLAKSAWSGTVSWTAMPGQLPAAAIDDALRSTGCVAAWRGWLARSATKVAMGTSVLGSDGP